MAPCLSFVAKLSAFRGRMGSVRHPGLFSSVIIRYRSSAHIVVLAFSRRALFSLVLLVLGATIWWPGSVGCVYISLRASGFGVHSVGFHDVCLDTFLPIGGCGGFRAVGIDGVFGVCGCTAVKER